MSPRRNDANVIGIFVNRKVVQGGQAIEILGAWRAQFNLRADVNFVALPALDRD